MTIAEEKQRCRRRIWAAQKAMEEQERQASDQELFRMLRHFGPWQAAGAIFLFLGVPPEPDTLSLLKELWRRQVKVAVPLCYENGRMEARQVTALSQLEQGRFGILEPSSACPIVEKKEISLLLAPAVCFDRAGRRIGRGGGYYDRFLADYTGCSVGLCRARFLQDQVPAEAHDQAVDFIVTETEIVPAR